jgi:LEA14-like dessication related protein
MERWKYMIRSRQNVRFLFLLLTAVCCFSCGPQVIKGRPPFISISGMSLAESKLSAEFYIRNENGVPMTIDMVDITVTVNGIELARENSRFDLIISANSAEHVSVEELPDEERLALLESLESGEVKSLPFDLNGKVHTVEDGDLSFAQKGYLYPVPGKPGYFRSTVTQAQGLQRDQKL